MRPKYLIYAFLILVFSACKSHKPVVENYTIEGSSEAFTITNHSIKGIILTLEVSYEGCKDESFTLVSSGMYKKTNPPSLGLRLLREPSDKKCVKPIRKKIAFNLKSVMYGDMTQINTLILRIKSYDKDIYFHY